MLQVRRLHVVRILTVVKISNLLVYIMRAYLFELVFTLQRTVVLHETPVLTLNLLAPTTVGTRINT